MIYLEQRAYYMSGEKEIDLFTYWLDQDGEIDQSNLPNKNEISRLLTALRFKDVHVESTGKVQREE